MNPPESYIGEVVEAGPLDGHTFAMPGDTLEIPVYRPARLEDWVRGEPFPPYDTLTYRFVETRRDGAVAYGRWVSDRPAAA